MFNRKTLFIIGAGAGFDIDLPVGRKLAEEISNRTQIVIDHGHLAKSTSDMDLALSFFERGDPNANEYAKAFRLIRDGVLLANSIDDFLNIHEGTPEIVTVGKAAIVRSILYAERHSKIYVDPSNVFNKMDVRNIRDSWLVKFMQVLGPGRKVPDVEHALDDVSFINFNYDRCLEYFLRHALQLMYGIEASKAAEIVGRATIVHPYGWVGPLERVPFGGNDNSRSDYRELSKAIKTYTEQIEEESTVFNMHEEIRRAECIVFLGFAYHKQNMKLLFEHHARPKKTKPVFGTAFGMSDADKDLVTGELAELFPFIDTEAEYEGDSVLGSYSTEMLPADASHINIENKLGCSELFDYYAKSLAG